MQQRVLFVEANTTGTGMLALQRVKELGFSPLFLTNDPRRYLGLEETAAQVAVCDTNSVASLQRAIAEQVAGESITGVATTSEFYLPIVAELAANLGLPGNPPRAMHTCRNKAFTRQTLAAAGVRQPQFAVVKSHSEAAGALAEIGLPCVVKPVDDTGSYGVLLCRTAAEVEEHAARLLAVSRNVRGQDTARMVLIEQYLDAPEVSVEMFTWNGETTCVGITEKRLTGFPHFVEAGHVFPAVLLPETKAEIETTVRQALAAAGIQSGATHTEVKYTDHGCAIVEINARLAGGMIPELIRHATSVDMVEQQIRSFVGQAPDLTPTRQRYGAIHFITAKEAGVLAEVRGAAAARAIPGVELVTVTGRVGSPVSPPRSSYDRLGFVIASGDSYEAVNRTLQAAMAEIDVVVTQGDREAVQ